MASSVLEKRLETYEERDVCLAMLDDVSEYHVDSSKTGDDVSVRDHDTFRGTSGT